MEIQSSVIAHFLLSTQYTTEHSVCPVESQSLIAELTISWLWHVIVMLCPPTFHLLHVKHQYFIPENVHHICKSTTTIFFVYINDDICVQWTLKNLIFRQRIVENLLVCLQIVNEYFRGTKSHWSIEDSRIDHEESSTFVDCVSINRHDFAAVGLSYSRVRAPTRIWLKCWTLWVCTIIDCTQRGGNAFFPSRCCDEDSIWWRCNAKWSGIFRNVSTGRYCGIASTVRWIGELEFTPLESGKIIHDWFLFLSHSFKDQLTQFQTHEFYFRPSMYRNKLSSQESE